MSVAALVWPGALLVAIFFVYPSIVLLATSFGYPEWSVSGYAKAALDPTVATILMRTFTVALTVTLAALLLAYPYAYVMTQVSTRWRNIMVAIVLIPFWTSLLARTFAWMVIFQANGPLVRILHAIGIEAEPLIGTQAGVTIAMVQVMLPFMILPLYTNLANIDGNLLRASSILGGNGFQTFVKVYLPLSRNGILAGSLLVCILSLGFYVTPELVGSPQESLIGQVIALWVQELLDFQGAGVLSVMLVVSFGVTLAIGWAAVTLIRRLARNEYISHA